MVQNALQTKEEVEKQKKKKREKYICVLLLLLFLFLLFLLFFQRDSLLVFLCEYEKNVQREYTESSSGNLKLNLAISQNYEISDDYLMFYIGYLEENVYDIVLTFCKLDDEILYQPKYISAGTDITINGTKFCEKRISEYVCQVSAYDVQTGKLVSDCINVIMKVNYN